MPLFNPAAASQQVTVKQPQTATVATVALTTASTTIATDKSATQDRRGLAIENTGTASVLIAYGTSVSATLRTASIAAGGFWEDPFVFQGPVVARASAGSSSVNVSEITVI